MSDQPDQLDRPPARLQLVGDTTASLFAPMLESWTIKLDAENKSPDTIKTYLYAMQSLVRWLDAEHGPTAPEEPDRAMLRAWLAHSKDTRSPATARNRWTGARSFFAFMEEEGELGGRPSPMAGVKPPFVPEKPAEMVTDEQLRKLLKGCEGGLFVDRRDVALISFYADTGVRVSEALINVDDLDLRGREARVLGKGRKERIVPYGARTARAIDRYKRMRDRKPTAYLPALWLSGRDGKAMTRNAVQQMFRRRGQQILEISNLHPHMLRHFFADDWLAGEGQEGDLMQLTGWKSRQMLTRYASKTRAERARVAYQGRSPMDKL